MIVLKRILGSITFFLLVSLEAQAASLPLDAAKDLIREEKFQEAIHAFDRIYWTDPIHYNEALFYIIYCQQRLGKISEAKANLKYLKTGSLTPIQRKITRRIASMIPPVPPSPKTSFGTISSNFGVLQYQKSSLYQSGYYYGLLGSWANWTDRVSFSFDALRIVRKNESNLTQNQFSLSYGKGISDHWSLKLGGIYLFTSDPSTNLGGIVSLSLLHSEISGYSFGPEFVISVYSQYPNGGLRVYQGSFNGSLLISGSNTIGYYLDSKVFWIYPSLGMPSNDTLFSRHYFSADLALRLLTERFSASLGGWYGQQTFAVQNGNIVFNVPVIRNWSSRIQFGYNLYRWLQIQIFGFVDSFQETQSQASTLSVGSHLQFFF